MEKLEEIRSVCGEIFARATEPIVVATPGFVMEGEVAIPVSVRERVIRAGNTMFPFPLQPLHLCSASEQAYLPAGVSNIPFPTTPHTHT